MKLINVFKAILSESTEVSLLEKLSKSLEGEIPAQDSEVNNILVNSGLSDYYQYLGHGTHGWAFLSKKDKKVAKVTNSKQEYDISKILIGKKTKSFGEFYNAIDTKNDYYVIVRKEYSKRLGNKMYDLLHDNSQDLYGYLLYDNKDIYNTFIGYALKGKNEKFIQWIVDFKKECKELGLEPSELDVEDGGIAKNIVIDAGNYKLIDF